MIKGNCLCTKIQYEYDDEIFGTGICHCNLCKRANGSAFAVNGSAKLSKFNVIQGKELLKSFRSSPLKQRFFCGNCGSHLYSLGDNEDIIRIRLGTVTEGEVPPPSFQIFGNYKAKWFKGTYDIPLYSELSGSELYKEEE